MHFSLQQEADEGSKDLSDDSSNFCEIMALVVDPVQHGTNSFWSCQALCDGHPPMKDVVKLTWAGVVACKSVTRVWMT